MNYSFKKGILLFLSFIYITIILYTHYGAFHNIAPLHNKISDKYLFTVILIPLDSRPPCTQFVEQLAYIAGIKVLMPSSELLDHYKTPANKEALRSWLRQASMQADAAIISTDILIHGSLVASRLSLGTKKDQDEVLQLLTTIHQENSTLQMYVFNIIPRLLLPDNQENTIYQKTMLQYSILKDKISIFGNVQDIKEITELEKQIPANVINHYIAMYKENNTLNLALLTMVEQGIITSLVIGQDDSQPFGIPNMNKQRFEHVLMQKPTLTNHVFITRGTDEVALTLLGHMAIQRSHYHPKIFVVYSTNEGAQITMPYMPNTVAKTVVEKIQIAGGQQVNDADQADFILYIHVGTQNNKSILKAAAQQVKLLLNQGYKVALVDLTEHFQISEMLLPVLLAENIATPKLIAYAGWNTTSNSIGTAITQGSIFTERLNSSLETPDLLNLYQGNSEFLIARFLDDVYFQKEINPYINKQLQQVHIDPYDLDDHYDQTNDKVQKLMFRKARWLLRDALSNHPVTVETKQGPQKIIITDLTIQTYLPWHRTFEVWLKPKLSMAIINE